MTRVCGRSGRADPPALFLFFAMPGKLSSTKQPAEAVVQDLSAPLPQGKRLRALLLFLSDDGEPKKRIHEDELLRFQGVHS